MQETDTGRAVVVSEGSRFFSYEQKRLRDVSFLVAETDGWCRELTLSDSWNRGRRQGFTRIESRVAMDGNRVVLDSSRLGNF